MARSGKSLDLIMVIGKKIEVKNMSPGLLIRAVGILLPVTYG